MPRLSDSMEEGTVLKWLVEEGGEVKRGEPLVEIETDKANMTYEADADGTLIEIVAQEGDTLAIGEPIARIGDPSEAGEKSAKKEKTADDGDDGRGRRREKGEAARAKAPKRRAEGEEAEEREPVGAEAKGEARGAAGAGDGGGETQAGAGTATKERAPSNGDGGRVKASPVARRMARELGVELARLEGSGPGGRIVKADVQAAAESGAAAPGDGDGAKADAETAEAPREERAPEPQRGEAGAKGEAQIQELTRLQQTVSRRMAESKATAPDFSISLTVDMTKAVELRKQLKEVTDPAPSFNDMVVKAAATALGEHPRVNGAYRDGKFELYERVNIGVAVAGEDALIVATVFDCRPQVARPDRPRRARGWRRRCATSRSPRRSCRARRSRSPTSACSASSSSPRSSTRRRRRS